MAALPQYLVNQSAEQPKAKIVPRPNIPQAEGVFPEFRQIKVEIRKRERRPKRILLGTINHADYRVVKPIPVQFDVRGGTVIASWRQIDEFGTGTSNSAACDDLGHTIAELYDSLRKDEPRLGPDLARAWATLKQHVVRRSHEIA